MALNPNFHFHILPQISTHNKKAIHHYPASISNINFIHNRRIPLAASKNSDLTFEDDKKPRKKDTKSRTKSEPEITESSKIGDEKPFPKTIPKKPRRGRRSEAAAVEDFMRSSLEETFSAIREQNLSNSEVFEGAESVIKDKNVHDNDDEEEDDDEKEKKKKGMVVEEEDPDWPVDAEIGWGIRASEYFEKHPIKNVIGEDGVEIDWEGELDDNLVKEINCLEWESFAFHPSPLIVLVFERYNRASENWKALKELEKAAKVYWNAKDRLPPRTVKLDMNLETDLAYALKVRECPQILFLRGNRIVYRESKSRTSDELVQLIAHFYYKAKKPSWMKDEKLYS